MRDQFDTLIAQMPYLAWLGARFDRDEAGQPVGHLPYASKLIGDSTLPALHGGVLAGFLEALATVTISWAVITEADKPHPDLPELPLIISATTTFMRSGRAEDCHGSATIMRSGRRYASVHARVWQNQPARPITEAICHFRMPARPGPA